MHRTRAGRRSPTTTCLTLLALLATLGSCSFVDYEEKPLEPEQVIEAVQLRRTEAPIANGEPVSLAQATAWLRERGPRVLEAVAEFETMRARAEVHEPLPNPTIFGGAEFAVGSGTPASNAVVPFGSIEWSLPLSGRRARADELARAEAEVARIGAIAVLRSEWLDLRAELAELAVTLARAALRAELSEATARTTDVARTLVEAGTATATDVTTFDLEHAANEARELDNRIELERVHTALSRRTGVDAAAWRQLAAPAMPRPPEDLPGPEELRALLVTSHPELLRLRADYQAADRALRLELALQYPDLQLALPFGGELGEEYRALGLGIGIDVPLFARNQRAIAEALGRREQLFLTYEAVANRALADLDGARSVVELAQARRRVSVERLLPLAERQLELVRRALVAGTADVMRFLDATRSARAARLADLESALALIRAWSALERATGTPFLEFDGGGDAPAPPEGVSR